MRSSGRLCCCWRAAGNSSASLAPSDVSGVSGTDSVAQPPDARQSNRDRRPTLRKTPRAPFPLITAEPKEPVRRQTAILQAAANLDTSDPVAGGGRGFYYEWEKTAAQLDQRLDTIEAGPGGGGGSYYVHQQTTASATWVIDHHLGFIPSVYILDSNGQQMIAEIDFPSDQTVVINHSAPYSGSAYLR